MPLWEISDSHSELTAFLNIDAWINDAMHQYKDAVRDYAEGNHKRKEYSDKEIFVVSYLYYLKKGELAEWT